MYDNLKLLINNEYNKAFNDNNNLNNRRNNIKKVYERISKRNGELRLEGLIPFLDDKYNDRLYRCIKEVRLIDEYDIDDIKSLIGIRKQYLNSQKEADEFYKQAGITKEEFRSASYKKKISSDAKRLFAYNKIIDTQNALETKNKMLEDMLMYVCERIVNEYELICASQNKKEKLLSLLSSITNKINQNKQLLSHELGVLTYIIDNCDNEKLRNKCKEEFDTYNKSFIEEKEQKIIRKENQYVDDYNVKEEPNDIITNYITSILSLKDENAIYEYLDSLKYISNIKVMILKMINLIESNDIKNILINYVSNLEINLDENDNNGINELFYYGLSNNKNIIFDDLNDIPKEYYKDVLKILEDIKNGTFNKSVSFDSIKKVRKIRENDIRLTYRRIDKNLYMILGVYCKKDNKGYDIVNSTRVRNDNFDDEVSAIKDALCYEPQKQRLLERNNEFYNDIFSKLNIKIK